MFLFQINNKLDGEYFGERNFFVWMNLAKRWFLEESVLNASISQNLSDAHWTWFMDDDKRFDPSPRLLRASEEYNETSEDGC